MAIVCLLVAIMIFTSVTDVVMSMILIGSAGWTCLLLARWKSCGQQQSDVLGVGSGGS